MRTSTSAIRSTHVLPWQHSADDTSRLAPRPALEGRAPAPRVIIVEFDSAQRAHEFYRSSTYQQAKSLRADAAQVSMYVVDGIAADR